MFEPLPAVRDEPEIVEDLVSTLSASLAQKASDKSTKIPYIVRHKEWTVDTPEGPTSIKSWKFSEYDYYRPNLQLPCRARGLFTLDNTIVARGYDKFFNQNEVPDTRLDVLKTLEGPFSVSTKENGCIIFISGLQNGTLLVCSKNSTGKELKDGEMVMTKHVMAGNVHIEKQLQKMGKTREELAKVLYDLNVTAVAELCDDDFEEHVVEYSKDLAGLYLHGLNLNTCKFQTYSTDRVKEFAKDWGFLQVSDLIFPTFDALWLYLDERAHTGTFEGREIEGFVVRAKKNDSDFFFKFKFNEPYYLYRQMREATKKLIDKEFPQTIRQIVLPLPKSQAAIINKYLEFVSETFKAQPELKDQYLESLGIIKLRKMFLTHMGYAESDGIKFIEEASSNEKLSQKLNGLIEATTSHYALVPIASIGCGKTTTFKILTHLMPEWGHVQSDDYFRKKLKFEEECLKALDSHKVVMVDKNHHKTVVRAQHFLAFNSNESKFVMPNTLIRYVGLNFLSKGKSEEQYKFLQKRLINRGANHQTLKVEHEGDKPSRMAKGFYDTFSAPVLQDKIEGELPVSIEGYKFKKPDDGFSYIINLDCSDENSSLANAKIILRELTKIYPDLEVPEFSDAQWQDAFEKARAYKPNIINKQTPHEKWARPIYVGIDVDQTAITEIAKTYLQDDLTWKNLVRDDRVQSRFHVTLIHCQAAKNPSTKALWELAKRKFAFKANGKLTKTETFHLPYFYDLKITKVVVVEGKLVTLQVELCQFYSKNGEDITELEKMEPANKVVHITVGTLNQLIPPFKSNEYLEKLVQDNPEAPNGKYTIDGQVYWVWNVEKQLQERSKQQLFTFYQL